MEDLAKICIGSVIADEFILKVVPQNIFEDAVFVIDTNVVSDKDISTDGIIYDEHSVPSELINVFFDNKGLITNIARGNKRDLPHIGEKKVFKVKRHYSKVNANGHILQRSIYRFYDVLANTLQRFVVVKYTVDRHFKTRKSKLKSNPFKRPHGNCKDSRESYVRTNPSVLDKITYLGQSKRPKQIISEIEKDVGGVYGADFPSQLPRNNMQIYNKLKQIPERPKARNTGKTKIPDYSKLFAMTVSGDFVKNASIHPRRKSDGQVESIVRSFCATNLMIKWLKLFCSPLRKIVTPTAFDMTYKCGPFYVTSMVFQHPMFVIKNTTKHPTLVAWIGTSNGKEEGDYSYMAYQLKQQGNHLINYFFYSRVII